MKTRVQKNELFQPAKMSVKELTPYLFIFPVLLILLMLVVYPLSFGIYISFFEEQMELYRAEKLSGNFYTGQIFKQYMDNFQVCISGCGRTLSDWYFIRACP